MTYPKLQRDIFDNEGIGPLFRKDKIPAILEADVPSIFVKTSFQSFTDTQKKQARNNIGAIAYADLPSSVPTGTLAPFAGTTIPADWLLCNGANVSRTTYAALFKVIGTAWGAGDGSTTFTLPNASGRVLQGGSSAAYLAAGLPNITGRWNSVNGGYTVATDSIYVSGSNASGIIATLSGSHPAFNIDASRSSSLYGASETVQPLAIQTLIIIKV